MLANPNPNPDELPIQVPADYFTGVKRLQMPNDYVYHCCTQTGFRMQPLEALVGALLPGLPPTCCCIFDGGVHVDIMCISTSLPPWPPRVPERKTGKTR